MPWSVYMLRCSDNSLYVGISNDVEARIKKHSLGLGAKYTRSHLPVRLVWLERKRSESNARKREAEIKRWNKTKKEALVARGGASFDSASAKR